MFIKREVKAGSNISQVEGSCISEKQPQKAMVYCGGWDGDKGDSAIFLEGGLEIVSFVSGEDFVPILDSF